MAVGVRVRLGAFATTVCVLVVLVVRVAVLVLHRFMLVLMEMALADCEPRPERCQSEPNEERGRKRLVQQQYRQCGAKERRGAEMSGGARRAEVALGEYV